MTKEQEGILADLTLTITNLRTENERLKDAIEWALSQKGKAPFLADDLRARAFPPKMETVEITAWKCVKCGRVYTKDPYNQCAGQDCVAEIVALTGTYQRPIVAKKKHREEIPASAIEWGTRCKLDEDGTMKYYREWEE